MRRNQFLRVLGTSADGWAKRWGLEPFSHSCIDCGAMLTTTIPFAVGELRGLVAPDCTCGNDRPPYCAVRDPRVGDLLDGIGGQRDT